MVGLGLLKRLFGKTRATYDRLIIEDPLGGSTAAPRFWSSGALRSAGSLAALWFDVGRSFAVVGTVLVLGFVLDKISAILSKVSAVVGKLGPSGHLGRLGFLELQENFWEPTCRILGPLGRLGFSKIMVFLSDKPHFLKFVGRRFGR